VATERDYDLIIVGGGPAGLTAGLYAARANLRTLLLEGLVVGGQLWNTEAIEDWPGTRRITGPQLAELMQAHAEAFGLAIEADWVSEVGLADPVAAEAGKVVRTEAGEEYRAPAVIVATGGEAIRLGVPGEEQLRGHGVSYCAVCDGPFFRNQVVAVVGGGDSAVQEALFLTRYASKVLVIHRRDTFRAQVVLQDEARHDPKIELVTNTVVEEILGEEKVTGVRTRNVVDGRTGHLAVGGVFVFIGFRPRGRLVAGHVRHDPECYIVTDEQMETSVGGLYAVGDVRAKVARQVTTAVGDATIAALAATRYLETRPIGGIDDDR
jgi:thioredoxin reductase (NADPH)